MENVSKAEFDGRIQVTDERFGRDKERIEKLETNMQTISELVVRMGEILDNNNKRLTDHERRLDKQESKPSAWLDRIISGVLGAVIAALVAAVMSGRI
jgi:hypothetical protein